MPEVEVLPGDKTEVPSSQTSNFSQLALLFLPPPPSEVLSPASSERFNVRLSIDRACKAKLERIGMLLGKTNAKGHLEEIINAALDIALAKLDPEERAKRREIKSKNREEKVSFPAEMTSTKPQVAHSNKTSFSQESRGQLFAEMTLVKPQVAMPSKRYIPPKLRDQLLVRSRHQCQYVSPSGQRCERKTFLHIDHAVPLAFGGTSDECNLQVLCYAHHREKTREEFGSGYETD